MLTFHKRHLPAILFSSCVLVVYYWPINEHAISQE